MPLSPRGFAVKLVRSDATTTSGRRLVGGLFAGAAAMAFGVAAAFLRWSASWPHRDVRQMWASAFTLVAFLTSLATDFAALAVLPKRSRMTVILVALCVTALVAPGSHEVLINAARYR
jgi:hypothetical protein